MRRPRILYLVAEEWYFLAHRLPVARATRDAGAEVIVATRLKEAARAIGAEGFRPVPIGLRRGSLNPLTELSAVAELVRLYRRERPDLAHHVSLKPVLYGSLAARMAGVPAVVNALTGLGSLFAGRTLKGRLVAPAAKRALGALLARPNSRLTLENPDDLAFLRAAGLLGGVEASLVSGSGVDVRRFAPAPEPPGPPVALLAARMIKEKGVEDLVEAARLLRARGVPLRVVLAGPTDPENPGAIPAKRLAGWAAEGVIEWLGPVADMPALWRQAHIAVLPTLYREGLPMALLEAAACGRPLVATDMPGCREIVRPGETGLLVAPGDPPALAAALERLASDATLRRRLGAAARRAAQTEYATEVVVAQTLAIYRALLPDWRGGPVQPAAAALR